MAGSDPVPHPDSAEVLTKQLDSITECLKAEGILNSTFDTVKCLKKTNDNPHWLIDTFSTYYRDTEMTLHDLNRDIIELSSLDYDDIFAQCIKLKGGSACLGFQVMVLACDELHAAVVDQSKERCILALDRLKQAYQTLKDKLEHVLELEYKIMLTL